MLREYKIKTEQFEGPLDLLLELIEKEKLDITRLSIATVADDFLKFIENNTEINLANLSEFLLTASQLILIKSKALLPLFEFTQEEEEEIVDLEERLLEYKRFKDASIKIGELYSSSKRCFSRKEEKDIDFKKFVDPKMSGKDLLNLYKGVIVNIPQEEKMTEKVMEKVVSLEDKMVELKASLEKRMKVAFADTIKNATGKVDVIVTFLAMLEMIKQRSVAVEQVALFGDILLTSRKNAE
jgi:segregation and condensation protein A